MSTFSFSLSPFFWKLFIYSRRNSPRSVRYDWFSRAYQRRGQCVAEIACGECVTGSVWLELDSAVKQCFFLSLVYQSWCTAALAKHKFVVATNLHRSGFVVSLFWCIHIFLNVKVTVIGKLRVCGLRIESSSSRLSSLQGLVLTAAPHEATRCTKINSCHQGIRGG